MNEVSAVEQGLQRVIGLGDEPDRRPDGLDDDALLAIHRSLVRLRTYDERSVVYHRQGRIGTYAIFHGHEAIQAGAVHALEDRDWIFPSYRDSAIGTQIDATFTSSGFHQPDGCPRHHWRIVAAGRPRSSPIAESR